MNALKNLTFTVNGYLAVVPQREYENLSGVFFIMFKEV